jgi:hypothetical protein
MAAELAFGADLLRDTSTENPRLVDHRVDGLLQLGLALDVDGDLLREVIARRLR